MNISPQFVGLILLISDLHVHGVKYWVCIFDLTKKDLKNHLKDLKRRRAE